MQDWHLERMTWSEVADAIKQTPFLLIPLGARLKEHGFHLPLNTDYLIAKYFAERVVKSIPMLVSSVIEISYYPAFTEYSGSEHIPFETAVDLVYQKCKSHYKHGISHIYILNTGFSTLKVLKKVAEYFGQDKSFFSYSNFSYYAQDPTIKNLEQQKQGSHADELETSMMLYIQPELVKMDRAINAENLEITRNGSFLTPNNKLAKGIFSPSGAWGNPLLATPEKGKTIVELFMAHLKQEISAFLTQAP